MGDDFTNHQAFAAGNPKQQPVQLLSHIHTFLAEHGYAEAFEPEAADRSIAIGPPGRWICIYDSAGNGDDTNLKEFEDLALHLSRVLPVVDVHMSDSAALQMILYRNGKQADQVADSLGIGHGWGNYVERGEYQGYPEAWADFLADPSHAPFLRHAWQGRTSDKMLSETAALLGWHPLFCTVGYTIDYDGIPVYYKDHLSHDRVDTSAFVERHYNLTV